MPLPNGTDLGTAKASLARAQQINTQIAAERVRLWGAIANAVTLAGCLILMAGSFYFAGLPEQQRIDRSNQEIVSR